MTSKRTLPVRSLSLGLAAVLTAGSLYAVGFRFGMTGAVKDKVDKLDNTVTATKAAANSPTGLTMPVAVSNITARAINPFGVVRFSLDQGSTGHGGIDLFPGSGASIFAVKAGIIVSIEDGGAKDGKVVKLLFGSDTGTGEGWGFIYETVNPASGIAVNTQVTKGQVIATNANTAGFANHLELTFFFNSFQFSKNQTCWVNQLDASDKAAFLDRFNNVLRLDSTFIGFWQTDQREGKLPFKQLLDTTLYPDGAQLCYDKGTDVRIDP